MLELRCGYLTPYRGLKMPVQMIELEEVQMIEASDAALEASAAGGLTTSWNATAGTAPGCGPYCL